ncbi:MAG: putative aconitase, partial [Granulosicoccus sp.]
ALKKFGVQFVMDTCWCMLEEPVIPPNGSVLMTNSGKYAHYGPGLVKRPIHFGSLADCVEAACTGIRVIEKPNWLTT